MSKQTISGITAELVQCGVPRWDEVSHHPPTAWWIFTDTTEERVEVIHIAGKTPNDEGWQVEVVCFLNGVVDVLNVIDPDISEPIASLLVWPGLPAAIEFALLSQRLWNVEIDCEEEKEGEEAL